MQSELELENQSRSSLLLNKLRNKPFWIWNITEHKKENIRTKGLCFNHIVCLPTKDGAPKAIFDYEELLYKSSLVSDFNNPYNYSFKHKHLWVKKGTGLGVT